MHAQIDEWQLNPPPRDIQHLDLWLMTIGGIGVISKFRTEYWHVHYVAWAPIKTPIRNPHEPKDPPKVAMPDIAYGKPIHTRVK